MNKMTELLPSFPPGPLDRYRKIASFDWRKLKLFIEPEEILQYKKALTHQLKTHPDLQKLRGSSLNDIRRNTTIKMKVLREIPEANYMNMIGNLQKAIAFTEVALPWDSSAMVKYFLNRGMFVNVLQSAGTAKHLDLAESTDNGETFGCFCLTEIGHGTNTKAMRTTATYSLETKEFIFNTPDFEAAKCWAGVLGQTATHVVVYAQLYTPDGVCHGLHQFVVQIRDTKTLLPLPGIIVGDMGEKLGLNGVDNGFLIFNNFHVSRDALLNKNGDVTEDGKYVSPFKDPNKRFGASLAALSQGRVNIATMCNTYLTNGVTIALRYAAVRKQFGPEGQEEIPILEYQTHQHRLLPYLAGVFAFKFFSLFITIEQYNNIINRTMGVKSDSDEEFGFEMHGLSSSLKPVSSWFASDGLTECRQACAGHGYLKAAGIGHLKNDNDANCTYEGENHVLIQQTSNWLMKYWPLILQGKPVTSPLGSINFLSHAKEILNDKFVAQSFEQISRPEYILRMYQWLVCYLLKISAEKYDRCMKESNSAFSAKNNNQVFYARNLSIAYINHFILQRFLIRINEVEDPAIKNVLVRLFGLYGLFTLEKHIGHLYQGGYFTGDKPAMMLQDAILQLCHNLKDDAVALVDVIAPCDFILNSVLGQSDGQVYEHLKSNMLGNTARPTWWKDILQWQPSKL